MKHLRKISIGIVVGWSIWMLAVLWTPLYSGEHEEPSDAHAYSLGAHFRYSKIQEQWILPSIIMTESHSLDRVKEYLDVAKEGNEDAEDLEFALDQLPSALDSLQSDVNSVRESLYTIFIFALIGLILYVGNCHKTAAVVWILTPISMLIPPILFEHNLINDNSAAYLLAIPVAISGMLLLFYCLKNKESVPPED